MTRPTRRTFIKGGLAVTAYGLVRPSLAFATGEPDILVVVFLRGGMDGLSLIPPVSGPDRGRYETMRPSLAIPLAGDGAALTLDGGFGLHPARGARFHLLIHVTRQLGDRFEQLFPVAEENTHGDQLLIAQLGKHVRIDGIVAEYLGVAAEAKSFEPIPNVHISLAYRLLSTEQYGFAVVDRPVCPSTGLKRQVRSHSAVTRVSGRRHLVKT